MTIHFNQQSQLDDDISNCIVLLSDELSEEDYNDIRNLKCNNTNLTFLGGLNNLSDKWQPFPSSRKPLIYKNSKNSFLIGWKCGRFIFDLLTIKEEYNSRDLDLHGRYKARKSKRFLYDLLKVPFFNEVCACIALGLIHNLKINNDEILFEEHIRPIEIGISHDIDLVRGDHLITQIIRLANILRNKSSFRYLIENFLYPHKYHIENIKKIINIEKKHNLTSIFYVLNGTKGRYASRARLKDIKKFINEIKDPWSLGIHYNYDTHHNVKKLLKQIKQISCQSNLFKNIGRAHYLRANYPKSFYNWIDAGITVDESLGYYDYVGFRAGIAGVYNPYDLNEDIEISLLEAPLVAMDTAKIDENHEIPNLDALKNLIEHIRLIGGRFSYLYHHDIHDNPEHKNFYGFYENLLSYISSKTFVNMPSNKIMESVK